MWEHHKLYPTLGIFPPALLISYFSGAAFSILPSSKVVDWIAQGLCASFRCALMTCQRPPRPAATVLPQIGKQWAASGDRALSWPAPALRARIDINCNHQPAAARPHNRGPTRTISTFPRTCVETMRSCSAGVMCRVTPPAIVAALRTCVRTQPGIIKKLLQYCRGQFAFLKSC